MEDTSNTKQCGRCGRVFPLEKFRLRSDGSRNKLCGICCGIMITVGAPDVESADGKMQCNHCKSRKPIAEFRVKRSGRRNRTCNQCCAKASASFKKYNELHDRQYYKNMHKNCQLAKVEVLAHYGGRCACCGEDDMRFLTLDHKNGDGAEHRKSLGNASGSRIWYWARNNDFPDMFQVLCYNCNCAKKNKEYCPHQLDAMRSAELVDSNYARLISAF